MHPGFQKLLRFSLILDSVNEKTGRLLAWLTLGMVLVTFATVLLRYLFNLGSIAVQESVTYMHALVFMLGAAYAMKNQAHVRVDIFYRTFSVRHKAFVDLSGNLLFLMPVCIFIFYISFDYVQLAWKIKETSLETGGLPFTYLLKTVIPAMAVLLFLQALADSINALIAIIVGNTTTQQVR